MWVRDPVGDWHLEGDRVTSGQSVVYTRRGQPRTVTLASSSADRSGMTTACGRRIDPRAPTYERVDDPGAERRCRVCAGVAVPQD